MELVFFLLALIVVGNFVSAILQTRERERRHRAIQLSDVDNMAGHQFEHYVAKLLSHQGFQTIVTVGSGDFGVDVIAQRGSTKFAVQVKRQANNVSRRAVSDSVTGKIHYKCNAAMVVTNAYYTAGAYELAKSTGCRLVDREELTNWILAFQTNSSIDLSRPHPVSESYTDSPVGSYMPESKRSTYLTEDDCEPIQNAFAISEITALAKERDNEIFQEQVTCDEDDLTNLRQRAIANVTTYYNDLIKDYPERSDKLTASLNWQLNESNMTEKASYWRKQGYTEEEILIRWEIAAQKAADAKIR